MKVTPGVWKVVGNEKEALVVVAGDGIASHLARMNEHWVCDEHGGDVLANAVLMASAKDLHAALKRCVPWMGKLIASGAHLESVLPNDAIRSLEMAEAALKKASADGKIEVPA